MRGRRQRKDRAAEGHRFRQPEGRRREDDDDAEPRRRLQGAAASACSLVDLDPQGNLTMSQGLNPDAIERSMFDVLVHRMPIEEVIDEARGRPRRLVDRPRRRRARALEHDRPRARAREGARAGARALRLHPDRHAAVARPADDQRARRRRRRDRPRPVRVPLAARPRPAREHADDDPREPQPATSRSRASCRRCSTSGTLHSPRGGRDPEGELRRPRLQHEDPQDDPLRRGAREGRVGAQVRSRRERPRGSTATWRRRCSMARKRAQHA